jgi:hypothetical protein
MRTRQKIRAILSLDQQAKFEALEKQWDRRHERSSPSGERESKGS